MTVRGSFYFLDEVFSAGASSASSAFSISSFLRACLSSRRFLASFTFRRRASAWSDSCLLLASLLALTRDLEWTATGFLMTRPSLISFLMLALELALAISLISLGSSHTFFFPHFITSEARRFWSFSELILGAHDYLSCRSESSNISL